MIEAESFFKVPSLSLCDMELSSIIKGLRRKRKEIERLIAALEARECFLRRPERVPKRRGRTSMGEAERQQVSERMKRYWADRRVTRQGIDDAADHGQVREPHTFSSLVDK